MISVATFIIALDPAVRTGWARGAPGQKPESGAIRLRQPKEERKVAAYNLFAFLQDLTRDREPDLLVYEEPWSAATWVNECIRKGRAQNSESLEDAHWYASAIEVACGRLEIPTIVVRRQSVLKHFTGRGSWSSGKGAGDGRENGKRAVIEQCRRLGLVPGDCRDDDRCDAIANHDYASALYGRKHAPMVGLFDEGRLRHA